MGDKTDFEKQLNNGLTQGQARFVEAYTDKTQDTYLNGQRSAMKAYGYDNPNSAAVEATRTLKKAKVKLSLREHLEADKGLDAKIRQLIDVSIADGIEDKKSRRHALQALDIVAKLRGDYAPEKHEIGPMSKEERKEGFKQVAEAIKTKRST